MATDYKVKFRTYEAVADLAARARERFGVANRFTFNIVELVRTWVGKEFGNLGRLHLDLFADGPDLAFVTFNPLTLHVQRDIWHEADSVFGEPKARFIIAHELGHILMHGFYRQAFSEDEKAHITFVQPEERAETQANWFAAAFLAPDHLIRRCANESEFCQAFNYPGEYIDLKRQALSRKSMRLPNELCPSCGELSIAGNWGNQTCRTCGAPSP